MLSTVVGILILVADVWAVVNTVQSNATTGRKVLWIVLIVFFPLVGPIVWYFLGPKN